MTEPIYQRRDHLLAQTSEHQDKVNRANALLQDHVRDAEQAYLAWSTGKDSTVLLHLCHQLDLDIEAIYYDADAKLPGTTDYMDHVRDAYDVPVRVVETEPIMDVYERAGGPQADGIEHATMRATVWRPVRRLAREGYDLGIVGLRAEESNRREQRLNEHGHVTTHVDGQTTLYPLADWTTQDVWAYHAHHQVPVHPAYEHTAYLDRDEIRTSYWCGESGVQYGRWYWLKQNYPRLFNRFRERFPDVIA
jgi:phosphoadenosine phosphosulfate reductase